VVFGFYKYRLYIIFYIIIYNIIILLFVGTDSGVVVVYFSS